MSWAAWVMQQVNPPSHKPLQAILRMEPKWITCTTFSLLVQSVNGSWRWFNQGNKNYLKPFFFINPTPFSLFFFYFLSHLSSPVSQVLSSYICRLVQLWFCDFVNGGKFSHEDVICYEARVRQYWSHTRTRYGWGTGAAWVPLHLYPRHTQFFPKKKF